MINVSLQDIQIKITTAAMAQILLILENDYTLQDEVFRLKIDGKGCTGFDYALGFSKQLDDDLILNLVENNQTIKILLDPFTAFYCKEGQIDYTNDHEQGAEGFHFENYNQKNYHGKFFKDESKVPT
ncbi:MAG: hypothetical protein HON90_14465 [Halobacteriovoraceae bacterium]|jgi:iron-sulfur cluster assembly accessory protein|nr:hypothetical protein [Halobacteriovoraceae bacterium]